jgi:hypothetical protein
MDSETFYEATPDCHHETWLEGLRIVQGDWVAVATLTAKSHYYDGIVHRAQVALPPKAACWRGNGEHYFAGTRFHVDPYGAKTPNGWLPYDSHRVDFALQDFETSKSEFDPALIGVADTLNNPLLETRGFGYRLIVPALTLLSAVALPCPGVMRALLSPGSFGFTVVEHSESSARMIIRYSHWAKLGAYVPPRMLECLAYWLERQSRLRSLSSVFHSVVENRPLEIPRTADRLTFICRGYRRGNVFLVEKMGAKPGMSVWPRDFARCELRNLSDQLVSIA